VTNDDKKRDGILLVLGDDTSRAALLRELLDYETRRRDDGVLLAHADVGVPMLSGAALKSLILPEPSRVQHTSATNFRFDPQVQHLFADSKLPDLSPRPADELRYWAGVEKREFVNTPDSERQKAKAVAKRERRRKKAARR
jgi:hypothetical protein